MSNTRIVSMRLPVDLLDQIPGNRTAFVRKAIELRLEDMWSGPDTDMLPEPLREALATPAPSPAPDVLQEPKAPEVSAQHAERPFYCPVPGCTYRSSIPRRCHYHPGRKMVKT